MNLLGASAILLYALLASALQEKPPAPEKSTCPMHQKEGSDKADNPQEGVGERGDQHMGFSHEKTVHHFRIYTDGGAIEADAADAHDTASRDAIRSHFAHILTMFEAGDFSIPMLIHAQNPPGTAEMKSLRAKIQYKLVDTERGGRILITANDPEALRAVHAFLRFQISDHRTGDTTDSSKP